MVICVLLEAPLFTRRVQSSSGSNFQIFGTLLLILFSYSCGADLVCLPKVHVSEICPQYGDVG